MDERELPKALEVEYAVLGALLIDKTAIDIAAQILQPEHFYRNSHRKLYEVILALRETDRIADQITVVEELRNRKQLDEIGGPLYVAQLARDVATSANVEYHAKIVLEKARLRAVITTATQMAVTAYEPGAESFEIIEAAQERIFRLSEGVDRQFQRIGDALSGAMQEIDAVHKNPSSLLGLETGLRGLDDILCGLQRTEYIIVAARPSLGKTALALKIATYNASRGTPVAMFSLEMSLRKLVFRILAAGGRVQIPKLRTGQLDDAQWTRIGRAASLTDTWPLWVCDRADLTVSEIRAAAREIRQREEIQLFLIDYAQLIQTRKQYENMNAKCAFISQQLKAMAKEIDVPVIVLSQLSRAPEHRAEHRPQLSDIRDSGVWEQDSDIVIAIYRSEESAGETELIVLKNRDGATGMRRVYFDAERAWFEDSEWQGRIEPPVTEEYGELPF